MAEEEKPAEQEVKEEVKAEEKVEEKKPEKKKKERQGKKPHKNKPTSRRYAKYKIEGNNIAREKTCPRCGPGIFLMKAKDRLYCGRCHYTSFEKEEVEQANK